MQSMTGFGRGESQDEQWEISTELKSVNNRFLEVNTRLPKELGFFENVIRDELKNIFIRGKISVFISLRHNTVTAGAAHLNEELAMHYHRKLTDLSGRLGRTEPVLLQHLLQIPDIFQTGEERPDEEELAGLTRKSLEAAMHQMLEMRRSEAEAIRIDMVNRLEIIGKALYEIEQYSKNNTLDEFKKLRERIYRLIDSEDIRNERLEQEIALIADKVDITEEIVRFRSHLQQMQNTLQAGDEVGKRITFILQEMLREANTANSKTTDIETARRIITIKEEIEKIREQAQNLV